MLSSITLASRFDRPHFRFLPLALAVLSFLGLLVVTQNRLA